MGRLEISLTPEELDAYLAEQPTARIATVGPGGRPHVVPLWFVWVDGTMFFNTTRGNRSVRNLEANPQASAVVDDGIVYDELRGVEVRGRIEEAVEDPRLPAVREAFGSKYFGGNPPPFDRWRDRFYLRLVTERVSSWDFRKIPAARARRDAEQRERERS